MEERGCGVGEVSSPPPVLDSASLVKQFLRELPEPLFTKCLYQMLVDAVAVFLPNDPDGNAKLVFSILDCLPKANRVSFPFS